MTDWAAYLACDVCEAKAAGRCFTLLSGGPEAVPSRYADVPHSSRKLWGQTPQHPRKPTPQPLRSDSASLPARRTAARTRSKAASWADVARKQGKL